MATGLTDDRDAGAGVEVNGRERLPHARNVWADKYRPLPVSDTGVRFRAREEGPPVPRSPFYPEEHPCSVRAVYNSAVAWRQRTAYPCAGGAFLGLLADRSPRRR